MNTKSEKRVAAKPRTQKPLGKDIAELLANTRQASAMELTALAQAAEALRADSEFLAEVSKGLVVEDILRAMDAAGHNRNTLATRLGKSRQYIGKILDEENPANFTIDTLAELAAVLGVKLHVRMLPESEHMIFARRASTAAKKKTAARKMRAPKAKAVIAKN